MLVHDILAVPLAGEPGIYNGLFGGVPPGDILANGLPRVAYGGYSRCGGRSIEPRMVEVAVLVHILAVEQRGLLELAVPHNRIDRRHVGSATAAPFLASLVHQPKHGCFIDG